MTSWSDEAPTLWLFAAPAAALLWAAIRTHYRVARGRESGRLRRPRDAEIAAAAAALAATFGFVY
ncbi:MAG TPA: hypothetical protein VGZ49_14740 [Xanthobacteraceae bacterium]|jgi:hypothetical protein|nr:hypothetical protein [Xanthobacteraceae bacterium]